MPLIEIARLPGTQSEVNKTSDSNTVPSSNSDDLSTSSSLAQRLFLDGFALTDSDYISKGEALRHATEAGST